MPRITAQRLTGQTAQATLAEWGLEDTPQEPNNDTYKGEWNRYKRYIDRKNLPKPGGKYLTRSNVDQYFEDDVLKNRFKITVESAARITNSLQWYADRLEHTEEGNEFIVKGGKRSRVSIALYKRNMKHLKYVTHARYDAHDNLPTDVLTSDMHAKALRYVFSKPDQVLNWRQFGITWTCDYQMFTRIQTMRKIRLPDLVADDAHGPIGAKPINQRILGIVIQPYVLKEDYVDNPAAGSASTGANKKSASRTSRPVSGQKRVTAMFRHKSELQCGVGHIAMSLFFRLHNDRNFSFLEPANPTADPSITPTWHKYMLLETWSLPTNTSAVGAIYDSVLGACGIRFNHKTHIRSSGIERGSTMGLSDRQLASMSKHSCDRLGRSYITELKPEVMKLMAGFVDDDPWWLPRCEEEPPFEQDEYVRHVFPQYERWVRELEGPRGDKDRKAAQNFVYKLIPFVARVVIQDSPYWITKFPRHPYSRFYLDRMPVAYTHWATNAKTRRDHIVATRGAHGVGQLNQSVRVTYEDIVRRQTDQQTQLDSIVQNQNNASTTMQQLVQSQQQVLQQQNTILQILQSQQHGGTIAAVLATAPTPPANEPAAVITQATPSSPNNAVAATYQTPVLATPAPIQTPQLRTVNETLRRQPRQQVDLRSLPPSLTELARQWYQEELWQYEERNSRRHWSAGNKMMYSKFAYLMWIIQELGERNNPINVNTTDQQKYEIFMRSAEELDQKRLEHQMSVNQIYKHYKATDPQTQRRNRGGGGDL